MKFKTLFVERGFNGLLTPAVALVVVLGTVSCASVRQQTKPGDERNTIQAITVSDQADKTEIVVAGQKPLIYTSYQLTEPQRLIVDLAGTSVGKFKDRMPIGQGAVVDLLPVEGEKPGNVVRLEITLSEAVLSRVRAEGERLLIDIDKPSAPPAGETTAPAAPQPPTEAAPQAGTAPPEVPVPPAPVIEEAPLSIAPALSAATIISKLTLEPNSDRIHVLITADGVLKPDAFMVEGNRLVVDLPDVTNGIRPNVVPVNHALLKRVRIGQHLNPKKVRVVFDLNTKAAYAVEPSGKQVAVTLTAAEAASVPAMAGEKPAAPVPVPEAKPAAPTPLMTAEEKPTTSAPAVVETRPMEAPEEKTTERLQAPSSLPEPGKVAKEEGAPPKKYTGRKISLDFQDADVSNVLRLLADVSGLNIVIGEDVKGRVSLKLVNVPWDQSLDIVLKMSNLGQVREGNIIRVATMANITKQQDEEAHAKETKIKAEDLLTKVIYVNYAKAEELAGSLKKNLSVRGDITVDVRTNTLIIKDIEKDVNEIVALVKTLDTRTPQVQIEARIIQADTSFAQSLGIQWGAGFAGISSNNVFGVQGVNAAPGVAQPKFGSFSPDFAVNMPANVAGLNAVPSVGFNFGRFTNSPINLDLRLSAGELNGLTKTISSPKVTTIDNFKAKIEQGESIPYQTSSSNTGPTTTFIDANLTLEVTPHITPDRSIIMKVKAARNSIGSFSGPAGPSIAKREATTEVLVRDGETTVIGGIFVDERKDTEAGIPLLSKIPVLGWLFKNEAKTDTKNELLIFLTPKIVKE
ncbi:MAG: type IV pilus secretin PilQ [Nitrospirae bacterium]|nr:type IV pilus secretin PilQ [Nitrospirota bacterium]